ncbi:MAG: hypothetical protein HZC44_06560 [Geobacter sp.]|nr:hypothetical protein [Geobacter sp.]
MKKGLLLAVALVANTAVAAYAMKFAAYNGDVYFDHRLHRLIFNCSECHDGPPQHFDLDHESGHRLCIGCHKRVSAGPARHCSDCHIVS